MIPKKSFSSHEVTFSLLILLVLGSVGASLMYFSPTTNNAVVLVAAFLMAALVVTQYMGFKREGWTVRMTIAVPVMLFVILFVLLLPDIAHFSIPSFLKFE